MSKLLTSIDDKTRKFIESQQIFFVATAASSGKVNLSPKGLDSFRILGPNKVAWLNLTGSGNET
ncbi:MAG: pyridoxamine 5'-phosphate oxidase family protein, partial [Flavobacteriaceae bacterium]